MGLLTSKSRGYAWNAREEKNTLVRPPVESVVPHTRCRNKNSGEAKIPILGRGRGGGRRKREKHGEFRDWVRNGGKKRVRLRRTGTFGKAIKGRKKKYLITDGKFVPYGRIA